MKKESETENKGYIRWFSEITKEDVKFAGGKGANLGEMFNSGFPVPPGFVITAEAYKYFLEKTKIDKKIYGILDKLDVESIQDLEETAKRIEQMIKQAEMPKELGEEIIENYEALNADKDVLKKASADALEILKRGFEPVFVAVRSSATAEDTSSASFAGQNETFLNIKGNSAVIESVKACWASLFTARSIYYRIKKGFKHQNVLIAVVIQQMINSDKSGVIFSKDPVTQDEGVIIEAVFGLGEGIVSGKIQPDHYIVSRDLKILKKGRADKKIALVRNSSGKTETIKLTEERSKSQVLSESEIKRLADYSIKLEQHYKTPQDTEFAIDSGRIYIVQTRPVTTLEKIEEKKVGDVGEEILAGIAASPGIGSGTVKIVKSIEDLSKIKKGDVLVTEMTNPDMVVTMQKSAAIITDEGGMTSHAAIVSREMGIPCVVGTDKATKVLKEGQGITVDGYNGKIYAGKSESKKAEIRKVVKTETKIKIIVDLPDFAERAAETGIKNVGLTRIEGIIAESGKHPYFFVKEKKIKDYEDVIFKGISKIAEYFDELWVRTSDLRSDEFRNLEGAPKNVEINPMLGMHGVRFSLKHREIMKAELLALKRVAEKGKKIGVMVPQVINVDEVTKTKEIIKEIGFEEAKIGVMIETPAAVQIIEELCQEGIDFISFGTNDLTQYTLAIDRGNEELQELYNETHPAVLRQLAKVIEACKRYGVESSICGQAGSEKKMVEFLVKHGIDSISVNADKAAEISEFVADMEQKGLRNSESGERDMAKKKPEKDKEIVSKTEEDKEEEKFKPKTEKKEKEDFPNIKIGFDPFKEQGVEQIDNLKHIEERTEEIQEKVEKDKKKKKPEPEVEERVEKVEDEKLDIF